MNVWIYVTVLFCVNVLIYLSLPKEEHFTIWLFEKQQAFPYYLYRHFVCLGFACFVLDKHF